VCVETSDWVDQSLLGYLAGGRHFRYVGFEELREPQVLADGVYAVLLDEKKIKDQVAGDTQMGQILYRC